MIFETTQSIESVLSETFRQFFAEQQKRRIGSCAESLGTSLLLLDSLLAPAIHSTHSKKMMIALVVIITDVHVV